MIRVVPLPVKFKLAPPDVTVLPVVFRAMTAPLVPTGADKTGVSVGVLILTEAGKPTFENAALLMVGKGRI